ncbi:hypothetical protein BJ170DRAFT_645572 [Xylariales sp. AK1849]|nr:hypothetical protein BJ170DRAFT_645572 [Xylariales sp. AK1849]
MTDPYADLVPGLNYTLPIWDPNNVARALEAISLYVGQVGGPAYRELKIRDGIDNIADLYVQTNGTAGLDQIATVMDSTSDQVESLVEVLGGQQELKQLILWASVHWDTVRDFSPNRNILALIIIFTIISVVTTGVRMYSRWRTPIGLKFLDYMFGVGVLTAVVMAGVWGTGVTMLSDEGSGAMWNVTYNQFIRTQLNAFLMSTLYHVAIGLIKCPILLFYYQMTPITYQRVAIAIVLFCCAADNLAGFFFNIFRYMPVDYWNHQLALNNDYNQHTALIKDLVIWVIGVANIVIDCLIWVMPLPAIWKLGKTWRIRAVSIGIVCSGVLPCIFSALRAETIARGNVSSQDGSLSEWQVNIYSMIEISIMIWCFNVPAIRALYASYIQLEERRNAWNTSEATKVGTYQRSEKKDNTIVSRSSQV